MGAGGVDPLILSIGIAGILSAADPGVWFDGVAGAAASSGVLERILRDSLAARGGVLSPDTVRRLQERGDCTQDRSDAAIAKCLKKVKLDKMTWVKVGPVESSFSRIVWFPLWGRRTWTLLGEATVAKGDSRRARRFSASFVQSLGFVGTAPADRFPPSSAEIGWAADSLGRLVSQELSAFCFSDSAAVAASSAP